MTLDRQLFNDMARYEVISVLFESGFNIGVVTYFKLLWNMCVKYIVVKVEQPLHEPGRFLIIG